MQFDKKTQTINFASAKNRVKNKIQDRDDLLNRMGAGEKKIENIPLMISNSVENVINPLYVAKFHSQYGFPKEILLEEIENKYNIKCSDYWSEWCDFWFDSIIKIPHNILFDSKAYYKAIE